MSSGLYWWKAFGFAIVLMAGAPTVDAAEAVTTGGALGVLLSPGLVDLDGDGISDVEFVSFGVNNGYLDAAGTYGLMGNIGRSPGSGAAWVSRTSTLAASDGTGRNENIAPHRGAVLGSVDN